MPKPGEIYRVAVADSLSEARRIFAVDGRSALRQVDLVGSRDVTHLEDARLVLVADDEQGWDGQLVQPRLQRADRQVAGTGDSLRRLQPSSAIIHHDGWSDPRARYSIRKC